MKWERKTIGEICNVISGGTPKRSRSDYWGGNIPWVKISDMLQGEIIKTEETITQQGLTESSAKLLEPGTLLLSIFATVGRTAVIKVQAATNQAIVGLAITSNLVSRDYLRHYLNASAKKLKSLSRGIAQDNINTTILKNFPVLIPPLEEQRQITKILDIISHLEDLHNKRNLHLNSFIDSLFNFYFGDLLTNSKSFKQRNFEDIVYFQEGPGIRKWQFRDTGIKLVNVKNIVNGELDINNTSRYLDESEVNKKYKHFLLDEGDLVMSSSGVTWGKIAYVESNDLPLCLNTSMIRLKPKSKEIRHSFIFYFIQSRAFKSQIKKLITGSAQPNFGPSHLKQIRCPLPSLSKQLEFEIVLKKYTKMYSYCKQIRNREEEFSLSTVNNLL